MTTQEIINDLRRAIMMVMPAAANRLEELQRELDGLRRVGTRPEPSRLEIAAMCLQGMVSRGWWGQSAAAVALEYTDKLIAAAKDKV